MTIEYRAEYIIYGSRVVSVEGRRLGESHYHLDEGNKTWDKVITLTQHGREAGPGPPSN